jgi:hypothetical protein
MIAMEGELKDEGGESKKRGRIEGRIKEMGMVK